YTANTGRRHFDHRLAIVAASTAEAQQQLAALAHSDQGGEAIPARTPRRSGRHIAFLFTGQGAQFPGMGREVDDTHPPLPRSIDQCDAIFRDHTGEALLEVLYPARADDARLHDTAYTQPALFALEYALAELWQSWGIAPQAVLGHSVGEYVAACVAGVFALEEGLQLVAARGGLVVALPTEGAVGAALGGRKRGAAGLHPSTPDV